MEKLLKLLPYFIAQFSAVLLSCLLATLLAIAVFYGIEIFTDPLQFSEWWIGLTAFIFCPAVLLFYFPLASYWWRKGQRDYRRYIIASFLISSVEGFLFFHMWELANWRYSWETFITVFGYTSSGLFLGMVHRYVAGHLARTRELFAKTGF